MRARIATLPDSVGSSTETITQLFVNLNTDETTDVVKLGYQRDATVKDLNRLLQKKPYSFDTERVTFRVDTPEGKPSILEEVGDTRLLQDLVKWNGAMTFEGKKSAPVKGTGKKQNKNNKVSPSDAVCKNEVGETKLQGKAKLLVGDRLKHDAANETESHVGNVSGN
ncbi:hypothetical protein FOCG_17736 [Fusarium oxysporum f. sp. radicis-lycopersici 26381]|nr:hypothetical protein FOCG_17736 [Fusarium oxysporum f. sp. radicis-lycopersici 26381]